MNQNLPPLRHVAPFVLPPGFVPTTLRADADRFGVSYGTIRNAMSRQGIPSRKTRGRYGLLVLPEGIVITNVSETARQLGVTRAEVAGAMRRQGIMKTEVT